ncbi:MAG TPA: hypothetical protein VGL04_07415 [Sporichthyaceae bacterium]
MTDLLFASSGIEDVVVAEAVTTTVLPGLVVPVARPGHLVALKLLIVERGFHRDRNLVGTHTR